MIARADWVTPGGPGVGVVELIDRLLGDDLRALASEVTRHDLVLGVRLDAEPQESGPATGEVTQQLSLKPHGQRV